MKIKEIEKLFDEFLSKIDKKMFKNLDDIDQKHKFITDKAFDEIIKDKKNFLKSFRDWKLQGDFAAPPQVSIEHFTKLGLPQTIKLFLKKLLFWRHNDFKNSFFDDLKILEMSNAFDLLKKNPVHITPGVKSFYEYKGAYTNYRWNRYAYLANRIIEQGLLDTVQNHIDIGSFYGGLQSFLKKKYKSKNYYLIDFSHQLLRSFIFLKSLYPDSNHIVSSEIMSQKTQDLENSFIYIPVEKFDIIKDVDFGLLTNFFSFGEMKRNTFKNYIDSNHLKHSKNLYFVNRFVSSPFFEKTYDSDLNIFDYDLKKNFKLTYFDIFPIHHYQTPNRLLFDKIRCRPVSSPYFEMVYKK